MARQDNINSEAKKKHELIKALEKGEQSGYVKHFDPIAHLKELHLKYL